MICDLNIRFLKALTKALTSLQASIDKNTDALREHQKSTRNSSEPQPQRVINPVIGLPPAVSSYYEAEQRERPSKIRWERIKRSIEVIALVAAVTLAVLTYQSFRQAQRQADSAQEQVRIMQNQLVLQERPWVKVKHRMTSPLAFNIGGRQGGPMAIMGIEVTLENVGQTVAINVLEWSDLIPRDLDYSATSARKRQAEWCDANRHPQGTAGYLLYPHDPMILPGEVGSTMHTIERYTIHGPPNLHSRIDGTVAFVIVGCVAYRSSFEPVSGPTHQVRYMYDIGKPENGVFFPNVIPRGIADQLRLISMPFYFSAD